MYCNRCGKQIIDNSVYCNFCGQKIEILGNEESYKKINEKPVVEEVNQSIDSKTIQDVLISESSIKTNNNILTTKIGKDNIKVTYIKNKAGVTGNIGEVRSKSSDVLYKSIGKRAFSYVAIGAFVAFFILLLIPFFINPSVSTFFRALGIVSIIFLVVSFIFIFLNYGIRMKWFIGLTVLALIISVLSFVLMANIPDTNTSKASETLVEKTTTTTSTSKETTKSNETAKGTETTAKAAEPPEEILPIGSKENPWPKEKPIQVGDVAWGLKGIDDIGDTLKDYTGVFPDKKTSGKFIVIYFAVKNVGTEVKTLTDLKVIDDKDREYVSYSEAFGYIPEKYELFILDNLNPGILKEYMVIYEVPKEATGFMIEVTNLEFAGTFAYIDLGL